MKLLSLAVLLGTLLASNAFAMTITEIPGVSTTQINIVSYPETQVITSQGLDGRTNTIIQNPGRVRHTDLVISVASGSKTEEEINEWLSAVPRRLDGYLRDLVIKKLNKEFEPIRVLKIRNAYVKKRTITDRKVNYHIVVNSLKVEVFSKR